MAVLGINCATENLSLAVLKKDGSSMENFWNGPTIKADDLLIYLRELLERAELKLTDLTKIGIAIGPGAFTGLRLALVTAKTLALDLRIPLAPISTLAALAAQYQYQVKTALLRVILEACRGDVSTALFDNKLQRLEPDHPVKQGSLPAATDTTLIENRIPDALTIARLASAQNLVFNKEAILKLVPLYSHESRINLTNKQELQHLKIGLKKKNQ